MTNTTVTIYKVECTRAFSIFEHGEGFRLTPWGEDTWCYEGGDDGGRDYVLPDGFTVALSVSGSPEVYDADGQHYGMCGHDRPILVGSNHTVTLEPSRDRGEIHYDAAEMVAG